MILATFAHRTPRVRSLGTMRVLSPPRQFETDLADFGAVDFKQDKGLASNPPLCPLTSARSADSFTVVGTGVLSA